MIEQGSDAWFSQRLGKLTASRMADVLATTKTGPSASRKNYLAQLVAERMTGQPAESFSSAAMAWGSEHEPLARAEYEIITNRSVEQIGFVDHHEIEWCGASPDGLVPDYGLVEIKCPNTATHIEYLLAGVPPAKYKPQMLLQLACTGRQWCDFVSYDPRMPDEHKVFIVNFSPKQSEVDAIEQAAIEFLGEVQHVIDKLNNRFNQEKEAA